jgi:hypothetical protein
VWAQSTSPSGPKTVPVTGYPITMASTLIMGYSIHDFLVQNIVKNPSRKDYQKIVGITFIIGILACVYLTLGSFGMNLFIQLLQIEIL